MVRRARGKKPSPNNANYVMHVGFQSQIRSRTFYYLTPGISFSSLEGDSSVTEKHITC